MLFILILVNLKLLIVISPRMLRLLPLRNKAIPTWDHRRIFPCLYSKGWTDEAIDSFRQVIIENVCGNHSFFSFHGIHIQAKTV